MKIRLGLIVSLLVILHSCSVEKFIPEDEYLYTGADISIESDTIIKDKTELKTELESVLRPKPNTKILGMQPGLYFHYKAQKEKPGFINKFLNKKLGEEPVYFSDVDLTNTEDLLLNRLENRGFFYSRVQSDEEYNDKNKRASASYTLTVPDPYLMETYQLDTDTLLVYQEIKKNLGNSVLEKDMRFDLPRLKGERERIDYDLKKSGYYNFNPGFLIFESDTNQYNNKRFDLFLRLKKDVPKKSIIPYEISTVNVYANYNVDEEAITKNYKRLNNKNYFQDELFFLPKRLDPYILIEAGDFYDPEISRNTSRRLGSIGAYKYVNIQYEEIDTVAADNHGLLQANIYLSPLKKRAIRAELQAITKSNSFAGPNLGVTFSNRNLFKGGESFHTTADVGYEFQAAGGNSLSSIHLGLTNDLIIPRLVFPIEINSNFFEYSIPRTKITLGADYLSRTQLFTLTSAKASYGYYWNANKYVSHEINPISLNFVRLGNVSKTFQDILDVNPFLRSTFDQEFIAGLTYSFIYNGMVDLKKQSVFFLNSNFDIAGNTISLLGKEGDTGKKEIFGLEYAQFAKLDADFRYHFRLDNKQTIATRLFAGYGIPYGNSDVMPFSKLYYAGGPYSVRAFSIRSLGPGTYDPNAATVNPPTDDTQLLKFVDQNGNIRLEANAEYRFPLFLPYVFGAFFADAGNVWNSKEIDGLEGGKFTSSFINELGIGGGFGVRVDIQNFVLRFDLAAPFHDPSKAEGNRWVWDLAKPIFNFGIGYPF
ncbi:BamA/TamA family outer membrane protein [Gramella sp. AN32]|uniref:BamA/TamA family outer membrane protein n=1 Tax=Christiangramia antarctica TaxID=2058158 RepID=A0ABW5WZH4_9FLAO|nr:BamA/TamA family outer membrane protein [Gramella sp. AN32]MCM4156855.1 hypothetical protein [Gramella sp. AN32]